MTYEEYCSLKELDPEQVTGEQAFRYGQLTVVALFADLLHLSLSYGDWEKSVPKMFRLFEEGA